MNPMRMESGDDFVSGGRYTFHVLRTDEGWRLNHVLIAEKWRRGTGALAVS